MTAPSDGCSNTGLFSTSVGVERKPSWLPCNSYTPPGFSPDWNPWKITCFIHCMSYKVGAPKVANAKEDLVHVWVYWLTNT